MKETPTTADLLVQHFAPSVFLSINQVSQIIGLAEQTLRNQLSQGKTSLPTRKLGRKRVVHVLDLARWIDERRGLEPAPQRVAPVKGKSSRPTKAD